MDEFGLRFKLVFSVKYWFIIGLDGLRFIFDYVSFGNFIWKSFDLEVYLVYEFMILFI